MNDPGQAGAYLVVGGLVTLADMAVYAVLTNRRLAASRVLANTLSTTCGMVLGFTMHFHFVFRPQEPQLTMRATRYALVVLASVYVVQNLVVGLHGSLRKAPLSSLAGGGLLDPPRVLPAGLVERMTGKGLAVVAGAAWNYLWFKHYVFVG